MPQPPAPINYPALIGQEFIKAESEAQKTSYPDTYEYASMTAKLELFSKGRQVKIPLGELRRRTRYPEAAGALEFTALLKKSKTHANEMLRNFYKFGIEPVKRADDHTIRKNVFVGLAEEEGQTLVRDFHRLTKDGLQCSLLSRHVLSTTYADENMRDQLRMNLSNIQKFIKAATTLISSCGLKPADVDKNAVKEQTDEYVKAFSLLTHGFGPSATVTALNTLKDVIGEIEKCLPPPSSPTPSNFNDSGLGTSPASSLDFSYNSLYSPASPPNGSTIKFGSGASRSSSSEGKPQAVLFQRGDDLVYDSDVLARLIPDQRIQVTVGEIRRRICGPEAMHASLLCAYLRKAKKTGKYNEIRDGLQQYNIDLKTRDKKGMEATSWSSLTEMEAVQLAKLTGDELLKVPFNVAIHAQVRSDPSSATQIRLTLSAIAQSLLSVGADPRFPNANSPIDDHIHRFAMMTHHFGHSFIAYVAQWLCHMIESALRY